MPVYSPYAELLSRMPVREQVVSVLGSETHYWVYGPEDAAVTIVVVHGYRGEHHGLEPVIAQFENVRFIAPDLPGFGESTELAGAHSVDSYGHWLAAFMTKLKVLDAVVLGHSFGSIVTSAAVANGLISPPKLILVNPIAASAFEGPSAILTRLTVAFYRVSLKVPRRLGYWQLRNWGIIRGMSIKLAESKDRAVRRFVHDQHHTYFGRFASLESVVESFDASVSNSVGDFAERLALPTLLIGADKDPITSVKQIHALAQRIPNSELHMIPGVGHLVHYETPRAAAEFIADFLDGVRLAPDAR